MLQGWNAQVITKKARHFSQRSIEVEGCLDRNIQKAFQTIERLRLFTFEVPKMTILIHLLTVRSRISSITWHHKGRSSDRDCDSFWNAQHHNILKWTIYLNTNSPNENVSCFVSGDTRIWVPLMKDVSNVHPDLWVSTSMELDYTSVVNSLITNGWAITLAHATPLHNLKFNIDSKNQNNLWTISFIHNWWNYRNWSQPTGFQIFPLAFVFWRIFKIFQTNN